MTNITFDSFDQELSLDDLNTISGGKNGKGWAKVKAGAKKVGDFIERTLGDGDGKHEFWDDYADDVLKAVVIVAAGGGSNVWGGPSEGDRTGLPA